MEESQFPIDLDTVEVKEFKPNLHHALFEAMRSDNPLLQAIKNLPEFQEQLAEQNEMLGIVNLRRRLSVSDELVDGVVEDIMEMSSMLAEVLMKNVQMSRTTGMRTLEIETPSGHMKIIYKPPLGRGRT